MAQRFTKEVKEYAEKIYDNRLSLQRQEIREKILAEVQPDLDNIEKLAQEFMLKFKEARQRFVGKGDLFLSTSWKNPEILDVSFQPRFSQEWDNDSLRLKFLAELSVGNIDELETLLEKYFKEE